MEEILRKIGLTERETRVYCNLLGHGSSSTGSLIKALGMHRAAVYDTLDLLIEKGLISFVIKENKKHFIAENPERLLEYLESKKELIENQALELKKQLPKLKAIKNTARDEQEAYLYKGKKGMKTIFEDVIKEKKTYYVIGSQGNFVKFFPNYFFQFHKKRTEQGIPIKIIRSEKTRGSEYTKELKLFEQRFLPDSYTTPVTTYVYANKVAIVAWSAEPICFLVKSRIIAYSYKKHFNLLWKIAKK